MVYGASDDLIEIEGDISEEFCHPSMSDDGAKWWLGFSDGTVLAVHYDGQWRFPIVAKGSAAVSRDETTEEEGNRPDGKPAYSDVVTLDGDVRWALLGSDFEKAKP